MNSTAASSSGPASAGSGVPASSSARPRRASSASPTGDPSAGQPGDRSRRDPAARDTERGSQGEAGKGADDVRGVRAAQGPREPGGAQPRVGDHDRRPGPPAGVRGGGEVGAGRDEQSDAVAGRDPVVGEADGELVDAPDEQIPGDRRRPQGEAGGPGVNARRGVGPGLAPLPARDRRGVAAVRAVHSAVTARWTNGTVVRTGPTTVPLVGIRSRGVRERAR